MAALDYDEEWQKYRNGSDPPRCGLDPCWIVTHKATGRENKWDTNPQGMLGASEHQYTVEMVTEREYFDRKWTAYQERITP